MKDYKWPNSIPFYGWVISRCIYMYHIIFIHSFLNECSSSVQLSSSLSRVQLFPTPWTAARQASLSISNSWSPPKLVSIESVMPSNHLILCHPLLLLPSIIPSIRVFSSESALLIRWPKYWSLSFSISSSNEYSRLISFRIDWFDLLAVHRTLKGLLQHHNLKASILWCSTFFMVHLSHLYRTVGKTIAFSTLSATWCLLVFNTLSRFVIAFLPRSKCFNFMAALTILNDFGAQENKFCHCFHFFSLFVMKWWNQMPWSSLFECWVLSQIFHSLFHFHQQTF